MSADIIPEELVDMIKSIVAYEEMNQEDMDWAEEWLYIPAPEFEDEDAIEDIETEISIKIEL